MNLVAMTGHMGRTFRSVFSFRILWLWKLKDLGGIDSKRNVVRKGPGRCGSAVYHGTSHLPGTKRCNKKGFLCVCVCGIDTKKRCKERVPAGTEAKCPTALHSGLTLSTAPTNFLGLLRILCKQVAVVVMISGRHLNVPYNMDPKMDISKPKQDSQEPGDLKGTFLI